MERIKLTLRKNSLVIIYVTLFVLFSSIAIWDVKEIIRDYTDDNTVTSVKVKKSAEEGYPFMDKPRVCLEYSQPFISVLSWDDFFSMLNDSWHQRDIVWTKNMTQWEKFETLKVFGAIKNTIVYSVDHGSVDVIDRMAANLRISKKGLIVLVDAFIEKAQENVNNLLNKATNIDTRKFGSWFVYRAANLDQVKLYEVESETHLAICFFLPLSDDLVKSKRNWQNYDLNTLSYNGSSMVGANAKFRIEFLGEFYDVQPQTNGLMTKIAAQFSNSRIFDSKRFSRCTSKFNRENDCWFDFQQSIIEQRCRCTPLSKVTENRKNDQKPFCTMRIYEKCQQKAIKEYEQKKKSAKEKGVCKPCLSASSNVKIDSQESNDNYFLNDTDNYWYHQYYLIFIVKEETYLVFEEKPQFTFSQLVSQIGGDLGLYIGFSMISILQLILFFYHVYRQQGLNSGRTTSKKWSDWFRFYFRYVARSFENEVEDNYCKELQELKEHMRAIQKQQQDTLKEMEAINNRVRKIEEGQNIRCRRANLLTVFSNSPVAMSDKMVQTKI